MNDNTQSKTKISPIILFRILCAGLKIIFEKRNHEGLMSNDIEPLEVTVELDLSLEEKTKYSLAKGLTEELVDITLAREYFDRFKSTTAETVDMSFKENLDLTGLSERSCNSPVTISFLTRRYIINKAIEELFDRKELLAHLFELIIFDRNVPEDYKSLEYESLQWAVRDFVHYDEDFYWNYLSPLFVKLFDDESLGSFAARYSALSQMSLKKDKAIVPIIKRLYNEPDHPFHSLARRNLYTAVLDFPDCFADAEYLKFKETAKRVKARMLANSSS